MFPWLMGGVGTPKVEMKAVWNQSEKSLVCGIKELDACGALSARSVGKHAELRLAKQIKMVRK
jgi:hypothetical protein